MSTPAATPPQPTPADNPVPSTDQRPRGPSRVVVVDDHAMFRTGVKAEIGRAVAVVGEAADADSAVHVILATRPDVVLLDVHLPVGVGVELFRRVQASNSDQ